MKFKIFLLLLVISIPFALSSQTRKPIPNGRFEALSGIKNHRTPRGDARHTLGKRDVSALLWNEIIHQLPHAAYEVNYYTHSQLDEVSNNLFSMNNIKRTENPSANMTLLYTDNLQKDSSILETLSSKVLLIIVKDTKSIEERVHDFKNFEIMLYQNEDKKHYYILKPKN